MKSAKTIFGVLLLFASVSIVLLVFVYDKKFKKQFEHEEIGVRKYNILQWTGSSLAPFDNMGKGNSDLVRRRCKYKNCFVTDKRDSLDESDFDAIVFNGRQVIHLGLQELPSHRTRKQKYIFVGSESSDRFPACNPILDDFFNWTWTYKLDSDIPWLYVKIYDVASNIVGPSTVMEWPLNFEPINEDIERKLLSKSKAAAWFASNCYSTSKREPLVKNIQQELKTFGWTVDVYGDCGTLSCPRNTESVCFRLVEKDYYFYFAFENSFAEDYVTEKLVTALNNYAIPVVYGAANYTRFLPPGSYLDAMQLTPEQLARRMNEIIHNRTLFHDFFRWRNYFRYEFAESNDNICKLCELLNSEEEMSHESSWKNFRSWWNGARYKRNCKT